MWGEFLIRLNLSELKIRPTAQQKDKAMKVLIIEDENAAARRLEKLLRDVAPETAREINAAIPCPS